MLKFTIITVCYNASIYISQTIESVLNQTYGNYEYLIIDGKSSDDTINIIKRYSHNNIQWISEKDSGIYDAMNKGINKSSGDFLIFMNAGDCFCDNKVLENINEFYSSQTNQYDVIYGDALLVSKKGVKLYKPLALKKLRYDMIASHQCTLIRNSILKENPFDLQYKLAADYNQISKLYFKGYTFLYFPETIAKVIIDDGATFKIFIQSKKEVLHISRKRIQNFAVLHFIYEITRFKLVNLYKKIF